MAKNTSKEQLNWAVDRLEQIQRYISAYDEIVAYLVNTERMYKLDPAGIREKLFELESRAWRDMLIWGITLGKTKQARIKAAIYDRTFADEWGVAQWLHPSGVMPSRWMDADEQDFRKMVKKAFFKEVEN